MTDRNLRVDIRKKLSSFTLDVSFSTGHGMLGILGPSGSGKSMTLKSIAGIVRPDDGIITSSGLTLFDRSRKIDLKPQKRKVGYLFQNYALFPSMTVAGNIASGLGNLSKSERSERVFQMIRRFRLEGLETASTNRLSGGQQQRVALARCLAPQPEVLLLDEPFSAMDGYLREGLRAELRNALSDFDGVSIMVTHDRNEAYDLCDDVILIDQGKVMRRGSVEDVWKDPGTVEAAKLLGIRNISRIERKDEDTVVCKDWNDFELKVDFPLDESVTSVGVRVRDIVAADSPSDRNAFKVENPIVKEMPDEWIVRLSNGLEWRCPRLSEDDGRPRSLPDFLRIDTTEILFLK